MPLVTTTSNLKIAQHANESLIHLWNVEGFNGKNEDYGTSQLNPIRVSYGDQVPTTKGCESDKLFIKNVHRGKVNEEKGWFIDTPVFRIPLEDFTRKEDLFIVLHWFCIQHFYQNFDNTNTKTYSNANSAFFEPTISDFTPMPKLEGMQLPIEAQDFLLGHLLWSEDLSEEEINKKINLTSHQNKNIHILRTPIENALTQVKQPGVPYMNPEEDMALSLAEMRMIYRYYLENKQKEQNKYINYSLKYGTEVLNSKFFKETNLSRCETIAMERAKAFLDKDN